MQPFSGKRPEGARIAGGTPSNSDRQELKIETENLDEKKLPADLRKCVEFHGHLCPGLMYGYLVGAAAAERLHISRSADEEIVAVAENDSCAVDGLQVMLGTTAGKGNLVIKNHGKSVFTVISRSYQRALRFSRKKRYAYKGPESEEFAALEKAYVDGTATAAQRRRQKRLKAMDLLARPVEEVFDIEEAPFEKIPFAPLAPSQACADCGEMTMATRMVTGDDGKVRCRPCHERIFA